MAARYVICPEATRGEQAKHPLDQLTFSANNPAWAISSDGVSTRLEILARVATPDESVVWCDLHPPLLEGAAYRLTIEWAVRTRKSSINLHVRGSRSGATRLVGTVSVDRRVDIARVDAVDFFIPENGFNQFMLTASQFTGPQAGTDITKLVVCRIPVDSLKFGKRNALDYVRDAMALAVEDHTRFVAASAQINGGARTRLMKYAHSVEKGLSHSERRANFGKHPVEALAREMNRWVELKEKTDDIFFRSAASAMRVYFDWHWEQSSEEPLYWKIFSPAVQHIILNADNDQGGVIPAHCLREPKMEADVGRDFVRLVYGRRSIREFQPTPVREGDIRRAVRIAMQAPSACNRQAPRVHLLRDRDIIEAAVALQGGFRGYKMPPMLLLVTADLTAFFTPVERNQAFIDGGLFLMALLLGLEYVGLGSCCLNTAMTAESEYKIRQIVKIPENEILISFIATGHFDPNVLTPLSKRLPVDEVLVLHDDACIEAFQEDC